MKTEWDHPMRTISPNPLNLPWSSLPTPPTHPSYSIKPHCFSLPWAQSPHPYGGAWKRLQDPAPTLPVYFSSLYIPTQFHSQHTKRLQDSPDLPGSPNTHSLHMCNASNSGSLVLGFHSHHSNSLWLYILLQSEGDRKPSWYSSQLLVIKDILCGRQ